MYSQTRQEIRGDYRTQSPAHFCMLVLMLVWCFGKTGTIYLRIIVQVGVRRAKISERVKKKRREGREGREGKGEGE